MSQCLSDAREPTPNPGFQKPASRGTRDQNSMLILQTPPEKITQKVKQMQIQKCLSKNQTEKQQPLRWRPSKTRGCSSTCYQKIWEKQRSLLLQNRRPTRKCALAQNSEKIAKTNTGCVTLSTWDRQYSKQLKIHFLIAQGGAKWYILQYLSDH